LQPLGTVSKPAKAAGPVRPQVLVVDDEPLVGRAVKRVLSEQADVLCATGGKDALALMRDPAHDFDVILCDLMMPDMTGAELRAALLRERPDLAERLVFITGGTFTADMEQFLAESACPHLLKPFDVPVLRSLVADRLAHQPH
jgi:CheY-like chemotaxis protein